MKFDPVSTSSSAKAGNEKFAGELKNRTGMELLKSPVAGVSGVSRLIENFGTRGIKKARRIPVLNSTVISHRYYETYDVQLTLYTAQRRRRW